MKQSPPIAAYDAGLLTSLSKYGIVAKLSGELALGLQQSGILEDGRDVTWLNDRRNLLALKDAHKAHNGKLRNNGGELRIIHEYWVAHGVYNDPRVQEWLKEQKIDRNFGAFMGLVHDKDENEPFDSERVLRRIKKIWKEEKDFYWISRIMKYMTDDDPTLHGQARIDAQEAKSFDADGNCIITPLEQSLRTNDKLSHGCFDTRALKRGAIPSEKLVECLKQLKMKNFVCRFPTTSPTQVKEYKNYEDSFRQAIDIALAKNEMTQPKIAPAPANQFSQTVLMLFAYQAQVIVWSANNMRAMMKASLQNFTDTLKK